MKRIAIINHACFRDTDLSIIKLLNNNYIIDWYLIIDKETKKESLNLAITTNRLHNFNLFIINGKYRRRELMFAIEMIKMTFKIKKENYYKILTGIKDNLYCSLIFPLCFKKKNVIVMIHDAESHPSINFSLNHLISNQCNKLLIKHFKSFLFFSDSQYQIFNELYKNKSTSVVKMPLKDSGSPSVLKEKKETICNFMFFGSISYYKGIELLIDAAEKLKENGYDRFIVNIYGKPQYNSWLKRIKSASIFNLNLKFIPDDAIPNLMEKNHFLVLPYRQVTQSGPQVYAFTYRIPIIASNIGIFTKNIINNKTGFLFDSNSSDDLYNKMIKCINMTSNEYDCMRKNIKDYVKINYNSQEIINHLTTIIDK